MRIEQRVTPDLSILGDSQQNYPRENCCKYDAQIRANNKFGGQKIKIHAWIESVVKNLVFE
jgi:hypothetical protein